MRKINLFVLISILLFTFTFSSFAQTDTTQIDLAGKFALQFQISQNFTLSSFQGGTFSGKYHFSNNSALRLGIYVGLASRDNNIYEKKIYPDTSFIKSFEGNNYVKEQIKFSFQYLYYITIKNSISVYLGAGPNYAYNFSDRDTKLSYNSTFGEDKTSTGTSTNMYSFGFDVLIGIEWFVRSNIGIVAEYGSSYSYSKSNYAYNKLASNGTRQIGEENLTDNSFNPYSVKFGVSIYF